MNSDRLTPEQIFVYRHPVDMRKQIDGLATIVSSQLHRDPSDRALYLFINRGRDKIKPLFGDLVFVILILEKPAAKRELRL